MPWQAVHLSSDNGGHCSAFWVTATIGVSSSARASRCWGHGTANRANLAGPAATDNAFLVGLNNFASNIPWLFWCPWRACCWIVGTCFVW